MRGDGFCKKCGRKFSKHKVSITMLPVSSDPKLQKKERIEIVHYCKKCEQFRTDLKE